MKKLTKMFTCLLAMLMLMAALTACGKSEEEKATNEIWEHMSAEAAEDGVDLEALMESEYAASQQRVAEYDQQREAALDFQSQVEARVPAMTEAYDRYTSATTGAEIIAAAEEFNSLYAECLAVGGDTQEATLQLILRRNSVRSTSIQECVYRGKAALADANISPDYTEGFFYFNPETNDSKFVFSKYNEAYDLEVLVLNQDGTTYIPDFSAIKALNPSSYSAGAPTENSLIVGVIANAEWLKYEFPLDDPTSTGVQISYDQPESEYACWNIWGANLDEFNAAESIK